MAQFPRDFEHLLAICLFSRQRKQRLSLRYVSRSARDSFFKVMLPISNGRVQLDSESFSLSPAVFLEGTLPMNRKADSTCSGSIISRVPEKIGIEKNILLFAREHIVSVSEGWRGANGAANSGVRVGALFVYRRHF